MNKNALAELEPDDTTAKRAQYEAFEFTLEAPGLLRVTNGSYGDDEKDDHTYRVNVEDGVPVACECPADIYREGACKHRVAVAIREPVLEAATVHPQRVVPDGGEIVTEGGQNEFYKTTKSKNDGRPPGCECGDWNNGGDLPCWPCYRASFEVPVGAGNVAPKDR